MWPPYIHTSSHESLSSCCTSDLSKDNDLRQQMDKKKFEVAAIEAATSILRPTESEEQEMGAIRGVRRKVGQSNCCKSRLDRPTFFPHAYECM